MKTTIKQNTMNPPRLSHLFALTVLCCASAHAATLVNEWKFEGNTDDTSPSGNHGTVTGSPSYIAGKFGQAISLPAGAKVQKINAAGLPVAAADAWSTNVWVYLTTAPVSLAYLCGFGVVDGAVGIEGSARGLIAFGTPGNQGIYFWGHSRDWASNTAYPLNQWAMITITRSGSTQTIYLNGAKIAVSTPISLINAPATITAGGTSPWARTWVGALDEFTIWSGALTDLEVAELYMSNSTIPPVKITKADAGTDLNATASWTGESVPTSGQIALWDETSLAAGLTLDAAASWRGMSTGGAASDIDISGTGNLTLGVSGIDMAAATVNLSMSQPGTLGAGQVWTVNNGRTLTASGGISGAFGLAKGGAGGLVLTHANDYSGATTITAGTLELGDGTSGHDGSLASGAISVGGTGTLIYNLAGDQTVSYPITGAQGATLEKAGAGILTLNNTGAVNFGNNGSTLNVTGGALRYTGLANDTGLYQKTIRIGQDATLEMNVNNGVRNAFGAWTGSYEGAGTLEKTGGGTLSFGLYGAGPRSVNFLPGAVIRVTGGLLRSSDGWERVNWTNNNASLALAQDATFDMNGDTVFVDALTGSGTVQTSSGSPVLTLGIAGGGGSFDGVIQGAIGITKTGDGTQVLSGGNTYGGNTTINAGTLTLAAGGQLSFVLGATSGANNRVSVTGDGIAIINGNFSIDTTAADGLPGGAWILLDVATPSGSFGVSFQVVSGFSPVGSTKWTKSLGGSGKVYTFDEETGILTLSGGTDFASWAATNAVGQTMGQDHDNDGVSNGIEYFMSLSGSGFTANPAIATNLAISWPKGAGYPGTYGTHYVIETSADLSIWDSVPETSVTIDADSVDYTLPTTGPKGFVRLKVTGP